VDNRGGAGGTIGAEIAARANADGYTVLIATFATHTIAPHVYRKLGYDAIRDFVPIALFVIQHNLLAAYPGFPPNTVKELIAYAKAKPRAIIYASAGVGSTSHFAGLMFTRMAGIEVNHVPYKGGGALVPALIAGEAHVNFGPIPVHVPLIKAGRVKPIAVSGTTRSVALPDVPTVSESGLPGYSSSAWVGLVAPLKTPKAVIDRLNGAAREALASADVRQQLIQLGAEPSYRPPDEFGLFVRGEYERYAKLVRDAGLKVE
jgi:tripartite-type tricarboxylate transporter receptor subunit TctC